MKFSFDLEMVQVSMIVRTFEHSPFESEWRSISGIVDLGTVAVFFFVFSVVFVVSCARCT